MHKREKERHGQVCELHKEGKINREGDILECIKEKKKQIDKVTVGVYVNGYEKMPM